MTNPLLILDPADNVATATRSLEAGDHGAIMPVPRGHKMARVDIPQGAPILKYAQTIGFAAENISAGSHIHTHNCAYRDIEQVHSFGTNLRPAAAPEIRDTFMGYKRANGKTGTRNYIAILTSVNCSATAAHRIANHFTPERLKDFPNVDGVVAFSHGTGCAIGGDGTGFGFLQRILWGYARHPNVGGVVMAGLGCEGMQIDFLLEAYQITPGPLFRTMTIQDHGGLRRTIEDGIAMVEEMLPQVNAATRSECPVSDLMVALQCGGSDALSGITANPALGYACDLLVAQGATGVLAETPEIYGAEHLLTARAATPEIGEKLIGLIDWWHDYTTRNRASMDNNPSPGNKKGGLTTILEKSLGAAAKGGTTPLMGVYNYAEPVTAKGFVFMDSPGYDPASVTGQIASGCTLVAFTTGRGSAFGCKPSPSIKIATNSEMFAKQSEDMDVNAGRIVSDAVSVEDVGREIYDLLLRVASGEPSKSEAMGLGDFEFVPWQVGAVM